jgi:hypothetical protein
MKKTTTITLRSDNISTTLGNFLEKAGGIPLLKIGVFNPDELLDPKVAISRIPVNNNQAIFLLVYMIVQQGLVDRMLTDFSTAYPNTFTS